MVEFLQVLGGLGLFLYGISMLSAGMEQLTGERIQIWLDRMTSRRITSALFGATATALIHSSGLLMVTMIGLINANLMTVEQSIGVMLGQEIGTTLTAQIVAFNIGNFNMLFVVLGVVIFEFFKHKDWRKYGEISFGIGIVFLGMTLMSGALSKLVEISWVKDILAMMGQYPLWAAVAGVVVTAIVQSSTAVTSITVAMGMSQVITLEGAVGIIMGANIGSCVTGLIASLRLSSAARQASTAQILINILGVLLFLPFIEPYSDLVKHTSVLLPRQIANAHTFFNLIVSALFFPFVKQIAWAARRLSPDAPKDEVPRLTAYIDPMQINVPAVAVTEAAREMVRMGEGALQMLEKSCQSLIDGDMYQANQVIEKEDQFVDPLFKQIVDFTNAVLMHEDLTQPQKLRCFQIKNLSTDIERIADMAEDLAQFGLARVHDGIDFSPAALAELEQLSKQAQETYRIALKAFETGNKEMAKAACDLEIEFDRTYWQMRHNHIERLEAGICTAEANVIYTEVLRLLERISDHADNLGVSVMRQAR